MDTTNTLVKFYFEKSYYTKIENIKLFVTQPSNRKNYYIITGECYKCLLMSSGTQKGTEMRRYYLKLENPARDMKDVIR
jgi:phage anti-repressor protein